MRNTKDVTVVYFQKGKAVKEIVKINFINQKVLDDYSRLMQAISEVSKKWYELQLKLAELKDADYNNDKKRFKQLKDEVEELSDEIKQDKYKKLIEDRIDLCLYILDINGYDGILSNRDVWYYNVEPDDSFKFLDEAINRDEENSKKK